MTHYNINYNGLTSMEIERQAVQDCKDYLTPEKFDEITRLARLERPQMGEQQWRIMCAFMIGIEGPPVGAWYRHIFPFG